MTIYIIDGAGILNGPAKLPVIPGIGIQLPGNAIKLPEPLTEPSAGHVWALVEGAPTQLANHRGTVYSTATGVAQQYDQLGELPEDLTTEPRPSPDHRWSGSGWEFDPELHVANVVAARSRLQKQVDAERDRRIDAGVEFQGVLYQSRSGDRENIAGSAQLAFMAIVGGAQPGDLRWADPAEDFFWIALDNSRVPMDAPTVVEFGRVAALNKKAHIMAGSDLKQMEPIPADFIDNKWWP